MSLYLHDKDATIITARILPDGSEEAHNLDGEMLEALRDAGVLVPVEMDIDEIVHELGDCVIHGSWGTGCDFDYAEARAIILRIGGDDER